MIFASLVDDPGEYLPEPAADKKRAELFALIERLVSWEANNDDVVLQAAREEIRRSCNGKLPVVVDPFCGSGSILIEALRLGLDTIGYDLNPIAVAISRALVEVPAVVSGHSPISGTTGGRRGGPQPLRLRWGGHPGAASCRLRVFHGFTWPLWS